MNAYRTEPSALSGQKVQICQNKTAQVELLAHYIREGLLKNEAVIVIAKPSLRKTVWAKLEALGLDMISYRAQGQIKLYDAELLLANILIDETIDEHYFHTFVGKPIKAAQVAYGKVRAFGEMTDILWHRGLHGIALQLETIRNDLCKKHALTVLCTHLRDSLDPRSSSLTSEHICNCRIPSLPINPEEDGGTLLELFGIAWDKVMSCDDPMSASPKPLISSAISSI